MTSVMYSPELNVIVLVHDNHYDEETRSIVRPIEWDYLDACDIRQKCGDDEEPFGCFAWVLIGEFE